jgi:hypothetical protein
MRSAGRSGFDAWNSARSCRRCSDNGIYNLWSGEQLLTVIFVACTFEIDDSFA